MCENFVNSQVLSNFKLIVFTINLKITLALENQLS